MARKNSTAGGNAGTAANLGFEAKLWLTAHKLRNNMDPAEYKQVVLGLIFLKYISDTFEEHRANLLAGKGDYAGANAEDADEYKAENVFWVPADARWSHLQASAKQPTIGKTVDDSMVAIERDNRRLKDFVPNDYARPGLGELLDDRKLRTLMDRFHREIIDADLHMITTAYHRWRGPKGKGEYDAIAGYCKCASTAEIAAHDHALTLGRYVGAREVKGRTLRRKDAVPPRRTATSSRRLQISKLPLVPA
jgi:type I restriction-modification system DNA methylase subunit